LLRSPLGLRSSFTFPAQVPKEASVSAWAEIERPAPADDDEEDCAQDGQQAPPRARVERHRASRVQGSAAHAPVVHSPGIALARGSVEQTTTAPHYVTPRYRARTRLMVFLN
jgi:hypothetical protein